MLNIALKYAKHISIVLLIGLLGYHLYLAVTTYQSMSSEQIQQAQIIEHDEDDEDDEHHEFRDSPLHQMKEALQDAGSHAEFLVWIAFAFWLLVEAIRRFGGLATDAIRKFARLTLQFLRENHRLVGWLALLFTAVHGIYYVALWLIKSMDFKMFSMWSGIASFIPFLLLAIWGEWLQRHGRDRQARKIHWLLGLLTVAGMLVHDFDSIGKLFIVITVLIALFIISHYVPKYLQKSSYNQKN